jgi:hypothetical protein
MQCGTEYGSVSVEKPILKKLEEYSNASYLRFHDPGWMIMDCALAFPLPFIRTQQTKNGTWQTGPKRFKNKKKSWYTPCQPILTIQVREDQTCEGPDL